jgi:hypothetical protein
LKVKETFAFVIISDNRTENEKDIPTLQKLPFFLLLFLVTVDLCRTLMSPSCPEEMVYSEEKQ